MFTANELKTFKVLWYMNNFAGYKPTVGEIAKVAGFSNSTVHRHLQKLSSGDMVRVYPQARGRASFRFGTGLAGWQHGVKNGWVS